MSEGWTEGSPTTLSTTVRLLPADVVERKLSELISEVKTGLAQMHAELEELDGIRKEMHEIARSYRDVIHSGILRVASRVASAEIAATERAVAAAAPVIAAADELEKKAKRITRRRKRR